MMPRFNFLFIAVFCLRSFLATSRIAFPVEQAFSSKGLQYCNIRKAVCRIHNQTVSGVITLKYVRRGGPISIFGQIKGLPPGLHGFHVHQYGDLSKECTKTGGHYNPYGMPHGAPSDFIRHVGDLGNIKANKFGVANVDIIIKKLRLCGLLSILGRSMEIHKRSDDLGRGKNSDSKRTGNAGPRLACCVIARAS